MQLKIWIFQGLQIPMIKDDNGVLYCTSKALCATLGLTSGQLRVVLTRHKNRLHPMSVTACSVHIQEFVKNNRAELDISRRSNNNLLLWPLDEALGVAFHVHTEIAWEFHQSAIQLIKQNAAMLPISIEDYERIIAQNEMLLSRVGRLEEIILQTQPALVHAASAAGAALSAQRGTKPMRLLN